MASLRERLLYPRAGWLSLGLLLVTALAVAWSVQGARWVEHLDFMAPVAVWAVLVGALLGMTGITIVVALPLGAVFGVGVVLWAVGGEYFPALGQLGRLLALRADFSEWLEIVLRTGYPPQVSPYAIGLGLLMFATAFAAAYAVYRRHRVFDAIALLGAAIITNMSATYADLFGHLLLFVIAAILLWLRATLTERQDGWQRRTVKETVEVPAAIMRSGIVFGATSVVLAWALTSVAVAAPLTTAWRSFDGVWDGIRSQVEGFVGGMTSPASRISGNTFGTTLTVRGDWVAADDEVLALKAPKPYYLRAVTYDTYTGRGWERHDPERRSVPAGDYLFSDVTTERPTVVDSVQVVRIGVEMHQVVGRNLFTAGSPLRIFAPVVVVEPDGKPLLGGIEHASPLGEGQGYVLDIADSVATEADLGQAGRNYPDEVNDLYLGTPGLTDRVADLARQITANATNDYQRVKALAAYLRSDPSFTYATKAPVPRADQDLVDFFLFDPASNRTGYCEYYASAMVLMTRSLGIPARVAVGFAPGTRQPDGTYLVREANAHAWAEVYFPGYGWQIFEATKSIDPRFTRLSGDPNVVRQNPGSNVDPLRDDLIYQQMLRDQPTPIDLPDPVNGSIDPNDPVAEPVAPVEDSRSGNALLIVTIGVGVLVLLWLRLRLSQRNWRLLPAGDRTWRQLTAAAERAGIGQRPSETIYEYAGWLEEQLPAHGEPIRTVADGKVLQAYSGQRLTLSAAQRLDRAMSALRLPMLGLAVRRAVRRMSRRDDRA